MSSPYDVAQINTAPRGANRNNPRKQRITLYFVGWEMLTAKGVSPTFTVKQTAIKMPPIGESIVVDEVFARDIRFMSQYVARDGTLRFALMTEAEGGEEIASLLKQARENDIPYSEINLRKIQTQKMAKDMSDGEIALILRQRNLPIPQELRAALAEEDGEEEEELVVPTLEAEEPIADEVLSEETETVVETVEESINPARRKRGRSKKNEGE